VIEESRKNYLLNSYGSSNSSNQWNSWNYGGSRSGTPTYSLTQGPYSSTAQRIQYTGLAGDSPANIAIQQNSAMGSFSAGDNATFSLYLKGSATGSIVGQMSVNAYTSSYVGLGSVYSPGMGITPASGSYTQYTLTYNNLPANTSFINVAFVVQSIYNASSVDYSIDAAQLEKGTFVTSYIPTTTSTVTRNADVVYVPTTNWNADTFTYLGVYAPPPNSDSSHNVLYVLGGSPYYDLNQWDMYGGNFGMSVNRADHSLWTGWPQASTYATYGVSSTPGGTLKPYFNGVAKSWSVSAPSSTMRALPFTAQIGNSWGANTQAYDAGIQRIVVYSSQLSDANVATATTAIQNGP